MLKEEDIVLGKKVRCLQYGTEFGKIGTIKDIIGRFFYVKDLNGREIGPGFSNTDGDRSLFDLENDGVIAASHPMTFSTRKVGAKVVCVYKDPRSSVVNHLYGMVGTIWKVDLDDVYHVKASNGEAIGDEGWSEPSSFNIIYEKPTTRPMVAADKRIGTRLICVFSGGGGTFGRVGTITEMDSLGGYTVMDDDGMEIGRGPWTKLSSFEVVVNSPIKSKETVGDIVVESVTVSPVKSGPCPAYYYGINACTCGKCSTGGALRFH